LHCYYNITPREVRDRSHSKNETPVLGNSYHFLAFSKSINKILFLFVKPYSDGFNVDFSTFAYLKRNILLITVIDARGRVLQSGPDY